MQDKRNVGSRWVPRGACAVFLVGALLALLWVTGGDALAKKPVKPPPPPPADGGTIYHAQGGALHQMAPDGSAASALPSPIVYWAEPSTTLHGGRWFLQVQAVPGETYPGTDPNTGAQLLRLELYAVHESGSPVIQLTDGQIDATTFIEPDNLLGRFADCGATGAWEDGRLHVVARDPELARDLGGLLTLDHNGLVTT